MYQFRDYDKFFDYRTDTLKELFVDFTDKGEYVHCKQDNKLYKYSYEIMCQDLATNRSWGNLNTHLLLLAISRVYNVQFEIIANEFDKITYVHAFENGDVKNNLPIIRLGHIFENHYVPIDILHHSDDFNPLFYNESRIKLHKWGTAMAKMKHDRILERFSNNKKTNQQKKELDKLKIEHEYSSDQFVDMSSM